MLKVLLNSTLLAQINEAMGENLPRYEFQSAFLVDGSIRAVGKTEDKYLGTTYAVWYFDKNSNSFFWGHYDLTEEQVTKLLTR